MNFRNIRGFSKGEIKRYRVVLFDVDGTIMYSSRDIGGQAMINAMEKTFCKQKKPFSRENIRLGGRCDPIIAEEVAYKAGVTMETFASKHSDFIREYKVELEKQIQLNRDIVTQTEGIANLLRSLQTKGVKLGVLTGNYNEIAPVKISAVHIDPNVFEFGAFGSDDSDRNALPKIALVSCILVSSVMNGSSLLI